MLCLWLWLRGGKGRLVVAGLWVFFFAVGWWLLIEKWQKRKVVGAWIVFFFLSSSSYCRSLGLWMVGQRWKWLLLLCCDGLVFLFSSFVEVFGFGICWCCCYWSCWLLKLLLLLIGVDVVSVVDHNGEKIIYYFNV